MRDFKRTPETRAKMRAAALERWGDPAFHARATASLRAGHNQPDARESHRQASLKQWRKYRRAQRAK